MEHLHSGFASCVTFRAEAVRSGSTSQLLLQSMGEDMKEKVPIAEIIDEEIPLKADRSFPTMKELQIHSM